MDEHLHWYCWSFIGLKEPKAGTIADNNCYASAYIGYPQKDNLTLNRIKLAKEAAKMSKDAVVLSVTYLGFVSIKEFEKDESANVTVSA